MNEVFLDTGFVVALAVEADQYYSEAVALVKEVEQEGTRVLTTRSVVVEIGNALAAPRSRT